jgi:O-succinylbenzoic acid--CoA ligase
VESDLIAVAMPPGPAWPALIEGAWGAGAAILPVDHRLPERETARLIEAARPTAIWDGSRLTRRADGQRVEPGTALAIATSGSTGAPKVVELTHDAVRAAAGASCARLGATAADGWLACMPLAHMGGLLCVMRALIIGAPVEVHASFAVGAVERTAAAFTSFVPTMLARALDAGVDLGRFRAILIGGADLPRALAERARAAGAPIVTTYGQTESCGGVVYDGVPLDGVSLAIEDGEITLGGPTLMRGYRLEGPLRGALRTGDAGEVRDGRLVVLGRLDDCIVTGGEKVWPAEVEDALRGHPGIADVAVVGVPDAEWGAAVVAVVVPATAPLSLEDLRSYARATLAPYKLPLGIVITSSLPRGSSGKVPRSLVVDRARSSPPRRLGGSPDDDPPPSPSGTGAPRTAENDASS